MLLPLTDPSASAGKVDLTDSASFNTSDASLFDAADDASYSSTPTHRFDSASEIQAVRDVFNVPRTSRVNYIILTEDKILATRLDRQTYYNARPQDKAPAVLFIQDQLLIDAGECSIKVQQVPHALSEDRQKHVQIHPGAITATFRHTLQAAGEGLREITPNPLSSLTVVVRNGTVKASSVRSHTNSPSHPLKPQHRSSPRISETAKSAPAFTDIFTNPSSPSPQPKTPIKISEDSTELTLSSEPDDHLQAPSTPSVATVAASPTPTVHGKKESWEPSVSKADIDYLVGIWKDDDLGLYSTQWPVPTHLAQLATKRAMTRLRTDDWKNTTTAPFSLIDVHENVRDTLYYL